MVTFPTEIAPEPQEKYRQLAKLGVVDQIEFNHKQTADEPFQYCVALAPHGYGHDFFDHTSALERALGEAAERYCWRNNNDWSNVSVVSCHDELKGVAIDPLRVTGLEPRLRQSSPLLTLTDTTEFTWIPTQSFTLREDVWCPLQLISDSHARTAHEPIIQMSSTIGLGAGPDQETAVVKGISELIEREAFMITYLNRLTPDQIDLSHLANEDDGIAHILSECKRHRLTPSCSEASI